MTIGNPPPAIHNDGREAGDLRPITLTLEVKKWAEGSCRIRVATGSPVAPRRSPIASRRTCAGRAAFTAVRCSQRDG
jgi:hypothetical protein